MGLLDFLVIKNIGVKWGPCLLSSPSLFSLLFYFFIFISLGYPFSLYF